MLIASLLFGISASLDALLVGAGYGVRGVRVRLWQNLTISLITLSGTCLSVRMGQRLASLLPGRAGEYLGSLVLMGLGLYYMVKWAMAPGRDQGGSLPGQSPSLRPLEVLFLSLTLSLNNLSAGLSASLAGLALAPAAAAAFACSVLFLLLGNLLGGHRELQLAGSVAEPLSGLLLVGLGLLQLFW